MFNKRNYPLALALLLTLFVVVRADKVDDYVKAEMQRQHVPGVSVVVIKDQKIIKTAGYGLANIELNVPATAETVYKIGSVSKQFIATGIMLLVQEGKISIDDPVSKFLEGTPDTWKSITIRHFLTHTSGVVREGPGFDPLKIQNDADVIKSAYPLPLRFTPGEKYEYCNVGYFSLAEIIRKVSGKAWGDFLKERVFAPLGMNATRTTDVTALVSNRANGYLWRNDKFENATNYLALRPSGAFLSTVGDLARWEAALHSEQILKQSTLNQMWTAMKLNDGSLSPYGFGWQLEPLRGHKRVHHGGSLPGFRAQLTRFVDDKLTVVVLTNGDNANAGSLAIGIANHYVPGLLPERNVVKVDPKIFDTYAGKYQPNPTVVVTVTRVGDKLMMQQGVNGENRELLPLSETEFFVPAAPAVSYRFTKDETGQAVILVMNDGSEVGRAKKIN
jgi:D-alanyl-D-alanine carboxypeptidase